MARTGTLDAGLLVGPASTSEPWGRRELLLPNEFRCQGRVKREGLRCEAQLIDRPPRDASDSRENSTENARSDISRFSPTVRTSKCLRWAAAGCADGCAQ